MLQKTIIEVQLLFKNEYSLPTEETTMVTRILNIYDKPRDLNSHKKSNSGETSMNIYRNHFWNKILINKTYWRTYKVYRFSVG